MGQILAIDYGQKNIGLAMSDETNQFASTLPVLKIRNSNEGIEGLVSILSSLPNIERIVFGLPLGMDFKPTQMSEEIKLFVEKLKTQIMPDLQIVFTNELYSSKLAEAGKSKKFKKEKSHSEAARIFLQEYLDHINMSK